MLVFAGMHKIHKALKLKVHWLKSLFGELCNILSGYGAPSSFSVYLVKGQGVTIHVYYLNYFLKKTLNGSSVT
jgi:hypothetical protein